MDMCNDGQRALHALPSSGADDPCFPWLDDALSMSLICVASHSRHVAALPVPEGTIPCMGIPRFPSKVSCVSTPIIHTTAGIFFRSNLYTA